MHVLRSLAVALLLLAPVATAQALLQVVERGDPGGPGEDGGFAFAEGEATSGGLDPVTVIVQAIGGDGGSAQSAAVPAGNGGGAALGRVFGTSTSGQDVAVLGSARGGAGGAGGVHPFRESLRAGNGASVRLDDAVDGSTSGALFLGQTAAGGPPGPGNDGIGGDARSRLVRHVSAASFVLDSQAQAGAGGNASATGVGTNAAGPVTVRVSALGSLGSSSPPPSPAAFPDAGNAEVWAFGSTPGDGQPVEVGSARFVPNFLQPLTGALGGTFSCPLDTVVSPFPRGGDARSTSIGIAHGNSPVFVSDRAQAGSACGWEQAAESGRSLAIAIGAGDEPVQADATAIGPRSRALSQAWGAGPADAEARASRAARSSQRANARAFAHGTEASARARTRSERVGALHYDFEAGSQREGFASAWAVADRQELPRLRDWRPGDASFRSAVAPAPDTVLAALGGTPALAASIEGQDVPAFGRLRLRHRPQGASGSVLTGRVEVAFRVLNFVTPIPEPVSIGLFGARAFGRGFEALTVRVETTDRQGVMETVFEQRYEGGRAARQALRDLWIEPPPVEDSLDVIVELETSRRFAGLDLGVLVAVPRGPTP